jgi:hypothetical protein
LDQGIKSVVFEIAMDADDIDERGGDLGITSVAYEMKLERLDRCALVDLVGRIWMCARQVSPGSWIL